MTSSPVVQGKFEQVLAALSDRLKSPTSELPSVHCISHGTLKSLIGDTVHAVFGRRLRVLPASTFISHLVQAKLVQPITFDHARAVVMRNPMYVIGLGADPNNVHPMELLQASVPLGVICYMSALGQHELTTQPVAHHHIAKIETSPSRLERADDAFIGASALKADAKPTHYSLGSQQFVFNGVPYYQTQRDPDLLRSYQKRYLNDKSWFQITTVEQTLVDTLHRPASCGGPAVIFEAWSVAAPELNVSMLTKLVLDTQNVDLVRRVGFMLDVIGRDSVSLQAWLAHSSTVKSNSTPISLLHNMPYRTLNDTWRVLIP